MGERRPTVDEVEALLADLAAHLEPAPALDAAGPAVARVAADLTGAGSLRRRAALLPRRRRRAWALAAAVVGVTVALLVALPGPRRAIADLLGIGGVRVRQVPVTVPPPDPSGLRLGSPSSLEAAASSLGTTLYAPAGLEGPEHVFVQGPAGRPVVSLVYGSRPELAPTAGTGIGLLVTELAGDIGPVLEKLVVAGQAERVRVGERDALWVEGPHEIFYVGADGEVVRSESRLAASTLVVSIDGTTVRLEGAFDRATALRLASSLVPVV